METACTAVTPCGVLRLHDEQCSWDVVIDVMIVEAGGIRALPDQRFAAFIPCARMDMLAAEKIEVALVICEAVCHYHSRSNDRGRIA